MSVTLPVLVLKEGTTRTVGRDAQRANIMAAKIVAETVKSSLGPRGMDKMLVSSFGDVTITNDGATILKEMDIQHPAAKMMVEVAKAQDSEVGDGTTTAVVLAGELLKNAEELLDQDVHPTVIIDGYRKALDKAIEILETLAIQVDPMDKDVLMKVALTTLSGKASVAGSKELLAKYSVEAILKVAQQRDGKFVVDIDDVKVEKKRGETLNESILVDGLVIDKEVVHAGMPKIVRNAKIAVLEAPLEIEKTEITAKINITSPEQMKAFLDEETNVLRKMVEKIVSVGANVVFCEKGIDDVAQHFLAKKGIMAARRVKRSDIEKLAKATGARIVTSIEDLSPSDLGEAELVEEVKVADEKMIFVRGCKNPRAVSILLRGSSDMSVKEAERSIHDALCVVRNVVQEPKVLPGGGAPEVALSLALRDWARSLPGREQLAAMKFADALEVIPSALAENAGLDPLEILVKLRAYHEKGLKTYGVDVLKGDIADMTQLNVYEPLSVKRQALKSATEAATMILKIDDVIAAAPPKKEKEKEKERETPKFGEEEF
ncbi:MAG: TCP-1/cpn60 chaperonin family protein [Candidatus Nezhaarchaeota archaeon]|nr:TCP-1/cpn60 chaperonin family protein [Candidatus Nezhaarchaeota archaeon]MCX8141841.1 TCP-1/cpn60 chaperonin family protein [Candidatus Nezhaarchaeota archaeon]MDW8050378.1 thermosome subunit alpha [Nitrososphaerota archaeon]